MTAARRLAAILAVDVVGYSRLMGEDEAGRGNPTQPASRVAWLACSYLHDSIAMGRPRALPS